MAHLLYVALGGAIGASLRHLSGLAALRLLGSGFPYGTFFVNVVGSFLMGVLIAWLTRKGANVGPEWRLLLATGVLGGFTTFSAFSLDAVLLWERGESGAAIGYVIGSVALSLLALMAGLMLVRASS
ncbi:MAG: fluoride efflux transporter CrcB [Hyphomicrobiales bacterium]